MSRRRRKSEGAEEQGKLNVPKSSFFGQLLHCVIASGLPDNLTRNSHT